jgi:hypothetical protein
VCILIVVLRLLKYLKFHCCSLLLFDVDVFLYHCYSSGVFCTTHDNGFDNVACS